MGLSGRNEARSLCRLFRTFRPKHAEEGLGHGGFKMKVFVGDGMIEVQAEGVEAKTSDGVVTIAVLDVPTHGVLQILKVHANLVFTSRL